MANEVVVPFRHAGFTPQCLLWKERKIAHDRLRWNQATCQNTTTPWHIVPQKFEQVEG